jgi:hypothetical protein
MLLGDYDNRGFALALLSCVATWPMEEMPHDDVAGFCPAAPQNYVSEKDLGEFTWSGGDSDMRCMP